MADLSKVMEREMLHSEHAAQCFLEAKRRDIKRLEDAPHPVPEREHLASADCWCEPTVEYVADDGTKVFVHRGIQ